MLIVAVVVAALLALFSAVAVRSYPWVPMQRRRVMVVLVDDKVVEGILYARRGPLLVLRNASVHHAGQVVPADGELIIERARVAWVQVLAS